MIQFNLLPDVKKEYVKAKRTKRLITSVSLLVSAGSVAIVLILFSVVQLAQKRHISSLSDDITEITANIQSIENIDEMLTVQNQLALLPSLHESKPATSRLFSYVAFVSPAQIKVTSLDFDFTSTKMTMQGTSDTLATVNKFVDNIKAVTYTIDGDDSSVATQPFSQVATQLSSDNDLATFKIDVTFDPVIFDNTRDVIMRLQDQLVTTKKVETQ